MKKSIAVISVLILVLSITFTACSKKNVIYDENGEKHVILTDKHGDFVQDEYGGIYEVITNSLGEKETKGFVFPDRVTNKRGNKIENSFIKLKVPKGWSDFSANNKLSIQHGGECFDMQEAQCQVDIKWDVMGASDDIYENYMGPVRWLVESQFNFGDLKEYETEIFGLPARAVSYRTDGEGGTFYYYLVERGLAAFEIEAYACDRCFTEDEIKEVIEKAYTLKDLGGVRPTVPSEESTEASSDASAE
ncbi:MAG: hypothetical protein IKV49_00325 [Clostridia bacterium]|nr:hypothetical protein [Clostridia bacterium]